jgi:hypothetical protein
MPFDYPSPFWTLVFIIGGVAAAYIAGYVIGISDGRERERRACNARGGVVLPSPPVVPEPPGVPFVMPLKKRKPLLGDAWAEAVEETERETPTDGRYSDPIRRDSRKEPKSERVREQRKGGHSPLPSPPAPPPPPRAGTPDLMGNCVGHKDKPTGPPPPPIPRPKLGAKLW